VPDIFKLNKPDSSIFVVEPAPETLIVFMPLLLLSMLLSEALENEQPMKLEINIIAGNKSKFLLIFSPLINKTQS